MALFNSFYRSIDVIWLSFIRRLSICFHVFLLWWCCCRSSEPLLSLFLKLTSLLFLIARLHAAVCWTSSSQFISVEKAFQKSSAVPKESVWPLTDWFLTISFSGPHEFLHVIKCEKHVTFMCLFCKELLPRFSLYLEMLFLNDHCRFIIIHVFKMT